MVRIRSCCYELNFFLWTIYYGVKLNCVERLVVFSGGEFKWEIPQFSQQFVVWSGLLLWIEI